MQSQTPIQKLTEYIKKNLSKGYTLDDLRFSLISQGYSKISIERAIETVNKKPTKPIQESKEKPEITHKIIYTDEDARDGGEKEIIISDTTKKGFFKRIFG
jgi:hypothetical protein